MNKVYKRTENGTVTTVDRKTGLDEINAAMIGKAKKTVRTMSSISRTDYAIDYKDGRSVRLVLADAPAPEGFAEGQAVVVTRPGRAPFTGTVAHIHTAPGYVAVLDDRHRAVSNYPTRFVAVADTEEPAKEKREVTRGYVVVTVGDRQFAVWPHIRRRHPKNEYGVTCTADHTTYHGYRNGEWFGPSRTASENSKPGTIGALVWAQINSN